MTTNKEKSGFSIEQDVHIHKAVEDSEDEALANAHRRKALNGGVSESPTPYSLDSEKLDNFTIGDDPGESECDLYGDDSRSVPTPNLLVHNTDTMDFVPLAAGADHPPGSPFVLRSRTPDVESSPSSGDTHLGGCTVDELVDDAAPTWSCLLKKENQTRHSRTYLKRQDLIWEMITTERNYVRMLVAIREVYRDPFLQEFVHNAHTPTPDGVTFSASMAEDLFPCVDRLSVLHGTFLHRLCQRQRQREDRAIHDLGDVLLAQFQGSQGEDMVHTYGAFYSRHLRGKRRVEELKHSPRFAAFLSRCESDLRTKRRTLDDVYLIINQRFSKLESLIGAIVENTIHQAEESEKLVKAKQCLKNITFRAEELLGDSQNKEMLDSIVERFDRRSTTGSLLPRLYSISELSSSERRILHYGKLRVFRSAMNTDFGHRSSNAPLCKMGTLDCLGILFSDMFVLLQETRREDGHEKRYQFLKEDGPAPSVLPFAFLSNCIVRESPQRHNGEFELYVIFNYSNASCRYSLYTSRQDERTKWAKVLTDAVMNTEKSISDRLHSIDEKYKRGCEILSQMQQTDWEIERLIDIKASLWQMYRENWDITEPPKVSSSEPPSERRDKEMDEEELLNADIEGMMKSFSREATKLHMLIHSCNTNLTRSASSAADQAFTVGGRSGTPLVGRGNGPGGGNLPRRVETFSGYDSTTTGKMTAGMYGKRPSLENATSDESVGTVEPSAIPSSVKSDTTLKVKKKRPGYILTSSFRLKLSSNNAILRHPEGTSKNKEDSNRRRSSVNFGNFISKFTKSSDKSHAAASPTSPSASGGTPSSLASPAESGATNRLSSLWDWSSEHLEARTPNVSVVQSLTTLNSETRRLIGTLSRLRTHLSSMENRLRRAEEEAKALQAGGVTPTGTEAGSGFHVVRETEKLRNQRAELERERTEFAKQRQRDKARIETQREEIQAKQEEIKKEQESFAEAKERFEEARRVLQVQIEQHERRGVNFHCSAEVEGLLFPGGRSDERRDSGQAGRGKPSTSSLLSLAQSGQTVSRSTSDLTTVADQRHSHTVGPNTRHVHPMAPEPRHGVPAAAPETLHRLPMKLADADVPGHGDSGSKTKSLSGKSKSGVRSLFKKKN